MKKNRVHNYKEILKDLLCHSCIHRLGMFHCNYSFTSTLFSAISPLLNSDTKQKVFKDFVRRALEVKYALRNIRRKNPFGKMKTIRTI